jgi:hypothetical protein
MNRTTVPVNTRKNALFDRHPAGPPLQHFAFTGRGFLPDVMSLHAYTMLPVASQTLLEDGFVPGKQGTMPVPGYSLRSLQAGQTVDGGAAGAGSFAARNAYQAKG